MVSTNEEPQQTAAAGDVQVEETNNEIKAIRFVSNPHLSHVHS